MSQDIDAELDALGREPEDLADLVASYAGGLLPDLGNVDAVLNSLCELTGDRTLMGTDYAPSTIEQPLDEAGPPSGEYSLGPEGSQATEDLDLEVSGEMSLPDERSGSYELPTAPPDDGAADDPASAMASALHSQAPGDPDTEQVDLDPFVETGDQTHVSATPDVTQVVPTDTFVDVPTPLESTIADDEVDTAQGHEQADIDVLFDELTNPSSRPPAPAEADQALCADDELAPSDEQRDAADVDADLARFTEDLSQAPEDGGYQDDEATAVFDAAQFRDLEDASSAAEDEGGLHDEVTRNASSQPPAMADAEEAVTGAPASADAADEDFEEFSMDDLEIEEIEVLEDDAADVRPPPPAPSMPPPTPGQDGEELSFDLAEAETNPPDGDGRSDRPSLIGRLLGRKKK